MRTGWSCLLLFHIAIGACAQDELLEWNPFYRLSWSDFAGVPNADSRADAASVVRIVAKPFRFGNSWRYDVRAYFNRTRSWRRDVSDNLLSHEQLHFDIAELYARKIRERINELMAQGFRDPERIQREVEKLLEESNGVDTRYDTETLHGAMHQRQQRWSETIERNLLETRRWSRKRMVIGSGTGRGS